MSHEPSTPYRCVRHAGIRQDNFYRTKHTKDAGNLKRYFVVPVVRDNILVGERNARSRAVCWNIELCKDVWETHQNSSTNFSTIGEISALRRLVSTITLSLLPGRRSTLVENPQVPP